MELAGLTAAEAAAMGQSQAQQPQRACPRCHSNNTKFCYFNNYSLSQPRYFCKGCRRYWTHGGTLRNVPVGGSSRKSKRPRDPSSASASAPSPPVVPNADLDATASTSALSLPAMGPNLFNQLHGGVGVGVGGGFLSSMRLQPPVLQGRHDFAAPFGWQQSLVGDGGDHVKAPPAVTGAQFWTLGGATSSAGGGDGGGHRGCAPSQDQCVIFPGVTRGGSDNL